MKFSEGSPFSAVMAETGFQVASFSVDGHRELLAIPPDEKIVGAVGVLQLIETGEIFIARERMTKLHFDKTAGDFSPSAGGRDVVGGRPEDLLKTLEREIYQETGLTPPQFRVDPKPVGWFQFPPYPNGPWIVAYHALTSRESIKGVELGPVDGETDCPMFYLEGKYPVLNALPWRGAMQGILQAVSQGQRYMVAPTSPGRHPGDAGIVDPTLIVVDGSGTEQAVTTWSSIRL